MNFVASRCSVGKSALGQLICAVKVMYYAVMYMYIIHGLLSMSLSLFVLRGGGVTSTLLVVASVLCIVDFRPDVLLPN